MPDARVASSYPFDYAQGTAPAWMVAEYFDKLSNHGAEASRVASFGRFESIFVTAFGSELPTVGSTTLNDLLSDLP